MVAGCRQHPVPRKAPNQVGRRFQELFPGICCRRPKGKSASTSWFRIPPADVAYWWLFSSSSNASKIRLRPGGNDASGSRQTVGKVSLPSVGSGRLGSSRSCTWVKNRSTVFAVSGSFRHSNEFVATWENWPLVNGRSSKHRGTHPEGIADLSQQRTGNNDEPNIGSS